MTTYISILRGINVSGHKLIRMEELKALYEELDFSSVKTFIQSGNVIFKTNFPVNTISVKIEEAIEKKYKFHVPVIVRTAGEIQAILGSNPFLSEEDIDLEKLHVTFLDADPQPALSADIRTNDFSPDRYVIMGKEVFLYCPGGYGNTKLSNAFFEKKLKVRATTRNWKTVGKLFELAFNG